MLVSPLLQVSIWCCTGLYPQANAPRERPTCQRDILNITTTLFEPLPVELQGWQHQSKLLRKWLCKRLRQPNGPAPVYVFNVRGHGDSKTPQFLGIKRKRFKIQRSKTIRSRDHVLGRTKQMVKKILHKLWKSQFSELSTSCHHIVRRKCAYFVV